MRIPLVIICSFFYFLSFAQENTLLYQIKGPKGETSYLFGTVHIIPDSLFYFPNKLVKTLAKADELVLEIGDINNQLKAQQLMVLENGTCFDIFTPSQKDSVLEWGAALMHVNKDVFEKSFSKNKPFTLMQLSIQKMMLSPFKMVEMELMSYARSNKQKVSGLETMEYQIGIFDQLPDSVMAEMIMEGIRFPEKADKMNDEMYQLYQAQNVEGLAKLINNSEEMTGANDALLYQRNNNWIPLMEAKMKEKVCFFAVGAGHLGGENGVIALLKAAGYKLIPINY